MTALATAAIATVFVKPGKRLGMTISLVISGGQEREAAGPALSQLCRFISLLTALGLPVSIGTHTTDVGDVKAGRPRCR